MKGKKGFQKGHQNYLTENSGRKIALSKIGKPLSRETKEKIEAKLVPDEITITSNPRWVYNKAKKDILFLLKEDIKN